ncbi:MAG: hypothetical protein ACI8ZB_003903 [Desulforhopalus sp.]|jgi:hypothetical protein
MREKMPEHLRALLVILTLATLVFAFAKLLACPLSITNEDYNRRRLIWFGVTLSAFLSHNFWIFIVLSGLLTFVGAKHEHNKFALYFFLIFTIPMMQARITMPVFLFDIHYVRLLSLTILLPALASLKKDSPKFGYHLQDKILLAYLLLVFLLSLQSNYTLGNCFRVNVFYAFTDILLPYYIASRSLNTLQDFRDVLMSIVVACMVLAAVAVMESGRHWLLYTSLNEALGATWLYGKYLARGGFLRALATPGQAIALGYVIAVAIGSFLYFRKSTSNKITWHLALGLLVAGLLAPFSRGPWIGAITMLLVFVITGPHAVSNITKQGILVLFMVAMVAVTPAWDRIVDFLPFVGTVDAENVEFRENLLFHGINLVMENPVFGSSYINLEQFRTGEGIIDIVNTYLIVALKTGLVGFGLFTSFFITICLQIRKGMCRLSNKDDEMYRLGQTLLGVLVGILLIIFTVSSITIIPFIYWSIAGIGLSYIQLVNQRVNRDL